VVDVVTALGVLLDDLCEPRVVEHVPGAQQRRPQPSVHERHLARDGAAHEHVVRRGDVFQHRVDLVTLRVPPPAAMDRLARDRLGEPRDGPLASDEDDAVPLDERQRLVRIHPPPPPSAALALASAQSPAVRIPARNRTHLAN